MSFFPATQHPPAKENTTFTEHTYLVLFEGEGDVEDNSALGLQQLILSSTHGYNTEQRTKQKMSNLGIQLNCSVLIEPLFRFIWTLDRPTSEVLRLCAIKPSGHTFGPTLEGAYGHKDPLVLV